MVGVIINAFSIVLGGIIGNVGKAKIPKNLSGFMLQGIGLLCLYIGFTGMMTGKHTMCIALSLLFGGIIGYALDIDEKLHRFGLYIESKTKGENAFAEGLIGSILLFCVGSMTILAPIQSGTTGENTLLYTKAAMDGFVAIFFSASAGVGVIFSAIPVFLLEALLVLVAGLFAPYLTDVMIGEINCVGSILLVALGLNLLDITHIKLMNFIPAVFLPILFLQFLAF